MCTRCNYVELLESAKLDATDNRLRVLEAVGGNACSLSADDILLILKRIAPIDRVTVYRIINLLVEHGILERLSTGGRAFYYGIAPNENHRPHPHFYCRRCGRMDCLDPDSLSLDAEQLNKTFAGRIDKVDIRVDGVCKDCLRSQPVGKKLKQDAS